MQTIPIEIRSGSQTIPLTTEQARVIEAVSPTVDLERTTNGVVITVEDVHGSRSETVYDGIKGEPGRVRSLTGTELTAGNVIEAIGCPEYIAETAEYEAYGITEPGWYIFARVAAPEDVTVTEDTTVSGADGYIAETGADYVDVAVRFEVAAMSRKIEITWAEDRQDAYLFKASDLATRNLDYRTTFYVYDIEPFATWEYTLTSDATFVSGVHYYVLNGEDYIEATDVVAGEEIPAGTYYVHSRVTFAGMARNVTYKCDTEIDCPQVYVLPEIEDETHGCWFEIRLRHAGSYSSTLQVPDGVKVATEHTQAETAGLNMVDLHYNNVGGVKVWRFLNTHSTIPA